MAICQLLCGKLIGHLRHVSIEEGWRHHERTQPFSLNRLRPDSIDQFTRTAQD